MKEKLIDYEGFEAYAKAIQKKYVDMVGFEQKMKEQQKEFNDTLELCATTENLNNMLDTMNQQLTEVSSSLTKEIDTKIDKSQVTDDYYGKSSDMIVSQKGIKAMRLELRKDYNNKASKSELPTKLSQLENDKTFKTESEIQSMIEKASSLKKEVVTSLPTTGKDDVIYLVKDKKGKENNNYLEYLWLNGKYELIGSTQVDLSGYVTHTTFDLYQQESDHQATLIAEMQQITRHALTEQRISQTFPDTQPDKLATSGQLYVLYQNMEAISESIGQMGQGISEYCEQELQKALKKSDIQEFTQQELEEAFK